MLKIGCCGFPSGMNKYFKEFEVAEVQTTFYDLPRIETARNWRRKAPKGFEFTVKAWQGITHPPTMPTWRQTHTKIPQNKQDRYGFFRPTKEVFEAWNQTREICEALEASVCLMQCPARFDASEINLSNMRRFFSEIDRGGMTIAWEPRGPIWTDELTESLCRELNLILCVDPFAKPIPTFQEIIYLRLHGKPPGERLYHYRYSDEDLKLLKAWIQSLSPERRVYCLFNNITMREDAKKFLALIQSGSTSSLNYSSADP